MKKFIQRLTRFVAYSAAGVVIFLAITVGLFRLLLPRLPEYQEEIKDWASAAIGMNVEFSGMDARWGLSGPELEFYNAELIRQDTMTRIVAAGEVSLGVGFVRLLIDRTLVVDRIVVRDTSLEVRQLENGQWRIQGSMADELLSMQKGSARDIGGIEIIGQNIELQFLQPGDERPRTFSIPRLLVQRDTTRLTVDASVQLPDDLGKQLSLSATQLLTPSVEDRGWDVTITADDLELGGLSELQPPGRTRLVAGTGNIDLSLAYARGAIRSATADVNFNNMSLDGDTEVAVSGRFEFHNDPNDWLLAADYFQMTTPAGIWPEQSLSVKTSLGNDGRIIRLDVKADYLNLLDIAVFEPWLDEQQNEIRSRFDPRGIVRNLEATLSDVDTDVPQYDVEADLEGVGISASGKTPGVRGFSATLRANRSGGRLEIDSQDMVVSLPNYLAENVTLDNVLGTLIWRRSNNRTTILSDSIAIRNADFDNETNIELTLFGDGAAPVIDLASTWSVADVALAKRYLPEKVIKPKTYRWLQDALLAGRVSRGTTRLYGPLDKFPFDGGEGRLLIEANVRDATFMYHEKWPATELIDLDVVLDNLRLYSVRNRSVNLGNEVVDAEIEITDFRQPVLTINALSTGTLETIRQFAAQSPIGQIFGGQLDRVTIAGDASFDLDLTVPIRDWQSFEFITRLHSSNGSLQIEGLKPVLTELSGTVTIDRDTISSEALGGQFLGRPVTIELLPAPASLPDYRIAANVSGVATAADLIEGFNIPLENLISGEAQYATRLLFPRGRQAAAVPFAIQIDSDLVGLSVDLPMPFKKAPSDVMQVSAEIAFPRDSDTIESRGSAGELLAWQLAFGKVDDRWDLDRGMLTLGGEQAIAAETRGLHLRGNAEYVRLQDWFDLSRPDDAKAGLGERIRSIDMTVDNLHLFGQHLRSHQVRVDRSASDWLVQFEGDNIVGSAFVPYDFSSGRELVLEMDKLLLPGDDEESPKPGRSVDPRSLPSISLAAAEFSFGDRFLGAVATKFERTEFGLEAQSIIAKDKTFEIVGKGSWAVDDSDPAGSRSFLTATLASTNVQGTMRRLNYAPGIIGKDMEILVDLSWSGGPRADFTDSLHGEVEVVFGSGQLDEVDPGAGRVFGLMSIVALPRRLSLDFRDVFNKGFGFDSIKGTFRIVDGETYTCNLSLEGPAADIGIVGRANLVDRDYEQTAIISAKVGNTLPVVGGFVAGPQVAAALLIFSQIFKKPLQDIGQVYYGISGSWDEPVVDTATAANFAASGALAGCLEDVL